MVIHAPFRGRGARQTAFSAAVRRRPAKTESLSGRSGWSRPGMKWRAPIWPRLWQGVATWNEWRARKPQMRVKLHHYWVLCGAILRQANLHHASLHHADLRGSDLRQAILRGADLLCANLTGAGLGGRTLAARTSRQLFVDVDLITTRGLENCRHGGPSLLDYRTLQRSERLPLTFLRGCGPPDSLIEPGPRTSAADPFGELGVE